jgi:hypothetical protein
VDANIPLLGPFSRTPLTVPEDLRGVHPPRQGETSTACRGRPNLGRRRGFNREEGNARQTVWEVPVNTRTIAVIALIIAVIVLILLLM